ncbi:hypothetical protein SNEBB_009193 [Seison nebaliae]|nr:hypothetical protein SNEBB_009193 [Seison nebaliae]
MVENTRKQRELKTPSNHFPPHSQEDVEEYETIDEIDYSHSNLNSISDDIFVHSTTLKFLSLSSNNIEHLSEYLFRCELLIHLNISDNNLTRIPEEIGCLCQLKHLDFSRNRIVHVSNEIKNCQNLLSINGSVNPLEICPISFFELKNLKELYLTGCYLKELNEIGNGSNKLEILELRENRLNDLPSSLDRLTKLKRLDIGQNCFTQLPKVLSQFYSLEELFVDSNSLTSINISLHGLRRLTYLDCTKNRLQELGVSISFLTSLTHLYLSDNDLQSLPNDIGYLESLKYLNIENNEIIQLPESMKLLFELFEFNCNYNVLTQLPSNLGCLKQLNVLHSNYNQLTELPDSIWECQSLSILTVRSNQLRRLPEKITELKSLKVLDLSENMFDRLPLTIVEMPMLRALWLIDNQKTPLLKLEIVFDKNDNKKFFTYSNNKERDVNNKSDHSNYYDNSHNNTDGQMKKLWSQQSQMLYQRDREFSAKQKARFHPNHFLSSNLYSSNSLLSSSQQQQQQYIIMNDAIQLNRAKIVDVESGRMIENNNDNNDDDDDVDKKLIIQQTTTTTTNNNNNMDGNVGENDVMNNENGTSCCMNYNDSSNDLSSNEFVNNDNDGIVDGGSGGGLRENDENWSKEVIPLTSNNLKSIVPKDDNYSVKRFLRQQSEWNSEIYSGDDNNGKVMANSDVRDSNVIHQKRKMFNDLSNSNKQRRKSCGGATQSNDDENSQRSKVNSNCIRNYANINPHDLQRQKRLMKMYGKSKNSNDIHGKDNYFSDTEAFRRPTYTQLPLFHFNQHQHHHHHQQQQQQHSNKTNNNNKNNSNFYVPAAQNIQATFHHHQQQQQQLFPDRNSYYQSVHFNKNNNNNNMKMKSRKNMMKEDYYMSDVESYNRYDRNLQMPSIDNYRSNQFHYNHDGGMKNSFFLQCDERYDPTLLSHGFGTLYQTKSPPSSHLNNHNENNKKNHMMNEKHFNRENKHRSSERFRQKIHVNKTDWSKELFGFPLNSNSKDNFSNKFNESNGTKSNESGIESSSGFDHQQQQQLFLDSSHNKENCNIDEMNIAPQSQLLTENLNQLQMNKAVNKSQMNKNRMTFDKINVLAIIDERLQEEAIDDEDVPSSELAQIALETHVQEFTSDKLNSRSVSELPSTVTTSVMSTNINQQSKQKTNMTSTPIQSPANVTSDPLKMIQIN